MDFDVLLIYVNLVVGGAGFVAYGLWAGKWLNRGVWPLFALNLLTSVVVGGFTIGFAQIINDPALTFGTQGAFRYLIPLVIGVPVWTRVTEYRRDAQRESNARSAIRYLLADRNNDG